MDTLETLVEVQDICKIYNPGENEVRALDRVSLKIQKGEFVAIIGHSGSGKSTLMNMLGCLDVPTSGQYFLNGKDVSHMTDDELSDIRNMEIGFIFQGFNLIPNLTAQENVELPLIYRGVGRKERASLAVESLEMVGLSHRMDHKPSEMSGGQQQRVAIARAIAAKPPVILADEPTGNLDSKSTQEIMNVLKDLHKSGRTVILITHDDEIAAQVKRVIRIKDGQIEADFMNEGETDNHEDEMEERLGRDHRGRKKREKGIDTSREEKEKKTHYYGCPCSLCGSFYCKPYVCAGGFADGDSASGTDRDFRADGRYQRNHQDREPQDLFLTA